MIKAEPHAYQPAEIAAHSTRAPASLALRLRVELQRALHILRDVLRGFCAGQPPDDSRPRGGCC